MWKWFWHRTRNVEWRIRRLWYGAGSKVFLSREIMCSAKENLHPWLHNSFTMCETFWRKLYKSSVLLGTVTYSLIVLMDTVKKSGETFFRERDPQQTNKTEIKVLLRLLHYFSVMHADTKFTRFVVNMSWNIPSHNGHKQTTFTPSVPRIWQQI